MTISYFEKIEELLTTSISSAKERVYVAVAWFTNNVLLEAIGSALKKGIEIKILVLNDILNRNEFGLDYGIITKLGAEVRLARTDLGIMHNKFCIIDNLVVTGSYNWTYHANKNRENILLTDEKSVVI